VRRALLSVGVGLAGAAALAGAGWTIQSVALPQPAHADRLAVDVEAWFHYHRFAIDIFHSQDRRSRGECLRGWYAQVHHHLARGSILALAGGPVALTTARGRVEFASGRRRLGLPAFLAARVGCTASLADELDMAAQSGLHLRVERAYAANQPVLALRLPRLSDERLSLYVSPRDYRPLVAIAAVDGRVAAARLYLARATPARQRKLRRLLALSGLHVP
jgi:hypothetical protein